MNTHSWHQLAVPPLTSLAGSPVLTSGQISQVLACLFFMLVTSNGTVARCAGHTFLSEDALVWKSWTQFVATVRCQL
ncbi:MAG TPA: hypothetical protein PLB25_15225 [Rhodoferax sp.]|nr:hypothetical protein [Rhodoferax sp.]